MSINNAITKINELIFNKAISLQTDLLIAKESLVCNKNLLDVYNDKIVKGVIVQLRASIYAYHFMKGNKDFKLEESELFGILFPFENKDVDFKFTPGLLWGEIIDDDLNQKIVSAFHVIYDALEENLTR